MQSEAPIILLTGGPGIGKTTIVNRVVSQLGGGAGGFYTRELRSRRQRTGFELVTLDGRLALLADTYPDPDHPNSKSFGRYTVHLDALEGVGVPALLAALDRDDLLIVDEIGPMEMLSNLFCSTIFHILDSHAPVLGTIVQREHPVADRIKVHPRVSIWTVRFDNRDDLPAKILEILRPTLPQD